MKKKALIVWGGWEGHEPKLVAARFKRILEEEGLEVTVSDTLDAYGERTFTGTVTEIRPIGTPRQNATYFDVRITPPQDVTALPGMNATVILP